MSDSDRIFKPSLGIVLNDPSALGTDDIHALTPEQLAADKAALDKYTAEELKIRTRVYLAEAAAETKRLADEAASKEKAERRKAKDDAAAAGAIEKAKWHRDVAEKKTLADITKARTSISEGVAIISSLSAEDLKLRPALIRAIRVDAELILGTLPPS